MKSDMESIEAEAAAWMARLHDDERTAEDDDSFKRWMAVDPLHRSVFEGMAEAWEAAGNLRSDVLARQRSSARAAPWVRPALAASILLAVATAAFFLHGHSLVTEVGERREMTLPDGSRLTLNTDSAVRIDYSDRERRVRLERGEAYFEVARQPDTPFIVSVAGSEITAIGTAFSVRNDRGRTQVVLVEGRVRVDGRESVELRPGQRLTLDARSAPRMDEPPVEKVTAWRKGFIALDRTSLPEAVAEMNRYSAVKLAVDPSVPGGIEVSGIFQAGDALEFARGLAGSHGLEVRQEQQTIVLSARG